MTTMNSVNTSYEGGIREAFMAISLMHCEAVDAADSAAREAADAHKEGDLEFAELRSAEAVGFRAKAESLDKVIEAIMGLARG